MWAAWSYTVHSLQQMGQKQRRTGSPHMQAKNWKLWDRSLSCIPPDGGNVIVQRQFTNRTGVCSGKRCKLFLDFFLWLDMMLVFAL